MKPPTGKSIILILLVFLVSSCKKNCDLELFNQFMYIPNKIQILDCKTIDDFIADGSNETYMVIKMNNEDILFFINENNLIPYRNTENWLDYFDPHFHSKALVENLDIPSFDLDNSFYNFWDVGNGSVECLVDVKLGYSVIRLEQ